MRIRRSQLEIFVKILKSVLEENTISKTHIMYRANLSFRQLQQYLPLLLQLDLIREIKQEGTIMYKVTDKGKLLLDSYGKIRELVTLKESQKIVE